MGLSPALDMMRRARPLGCSSSALNRCSVSTSCDKMSRCQGKQETKCQQWNAVLTLMYLQAAKDSIFMHLHSK